MTTLIPSQKRRSRWLDWEPKGAISGTMSKAEPTKPAKADIVGFAGFSLDAPQKNSPDSDSISIDRRTSLMTTDQPASAGFARTVTDVMPEWMAKLSDRLKEIKKKREEEKHTNVARAQTLDQPVLPTLPSASDEAAQGSSLTGQQEVRTIRVAGSDNRQENAESENFSISKGKA
jgi:hypothetical protein